MKDEINDLMTRVDLDGSGDLDVDEFVALMMESSGFSASANRDEFKIGLPGKLILNKRKGLWEVIFS